MSGWVFLMGRVDAEAQIENSLYILKVKIHFNALSDFFIFNLTPTILIFIQNLFAMRMEPLTSKQRGNTQLGIYHQC